MNLKWLVVSAVCVAMGCANAFNEDTDRAHTVPPVKSEYSPAALQACDSRDLNAAYEATDHSVHEMVTCGGMQVALAQNMVGILMLSNRRMFDETSREQLAELGDWLPQNAFSMTKPGHWEVAMGNDSTFGVRIFEPNGGELIVDDPFDMESYLVGLEATYTMTFDEMMDNPETPNHWEFTWDEAGPLVHLLNDGEPVPERFSLELSLVQIVDIIFPGWLEAGADVADLGPFQSLMQLEMDSEIQFADERGAAVVDYRVTTPRQDLHTVAQSQSLLMQLDYLGTTSGDRELVATESTLEYNGGIGSLKGMLLLTSGDDEVVMDFGEGAGYPEARWMCGE